jgi:nucleoid DNA-binding protein
MDELVNVVMEKTGLSEEQATQAVETVIAYLKKKLPAPIASRLDDILESDATAQGIDQLAKGLSGLLNQ